MKKSILIHLGALSMLGFFLAGCYSVPLVTDNLATADKRLLGTWKLIHERKHPEDKLDRIVMTPRAEFRQHPSNPKHYLVKNLNTMNKISYNEGYSTQYKGKTFLVFWMRMKRGGPPSIYKTWYVDFIKDNEVKVYSVMIPNIKSIQSVGQFQRLYDKSGASAHFYEATYRKL